MGVKGAILGDIIGSQYEFPRMRPKNLDWQNVPLISQKCKRTDDTILTLATTDMRKIYKWDETCQGSVPAAIRCVLEANSYEEFIRNVMSLPCDMDTLGAIGGGIAEELFGFVDIDAEGILEQFLEPNLFDLVIKEN